MMHAGPIMDKIDGIDRHCETVLTNSSCEYLNLGCLGCAFKTYICSFAVGDGLFACGDIIKSIDWKIKEDKGE